MSISLNICACIIQNIACTWLVCKLTMLDVIGNYRFSPNGLPMYTCICSTMHVMWCGFLITGMFWQHLAGRRPSVLQPRWPLSFYIALDLRRHEVLFRLCTCCGWQQSFLGLRQRWSFARCRISSNSLFYHKTTMEDSPMDMGVFTICSYRNIGWHRLLCRKLCCWLRMPSRDNLG